MYRKNIEKVCGGIAKLFGNPECGKEMTYLRFEADFFLKEIERAAQYRVAYLDAAAEEVKNSSVPVFDLSYEDLMTNETKYMTDLFAFFGFPNLLDRHSVRKRARSTTNARGDVQKKTPNDLRRVISNYDAVVRKLKRLDALVNVPSCKLVDMFKDTGTRSFPDCDVKALASAMRNVQTSFLRDTW
mmetsp:Transcript_22197/g.71552  ORF Transcript_22197/g.71552 Transcript_22197/m.71552 type:complete len:186 (+) Transcript_22197:822-1379(+)